MQFLVLATDATDEEALERRMEARDAHIALISRYKEQGNMILGAARLDENGTMIGSVIICDFEERSALDSWLAEEPYVKHNVWADITVEPCAIGPSFLERK